jgi:glucose uptake protein GlcU
MNNKDVEFLQMLLFSVGFVAVLALIASVYIIAKKKDCKNDSTECANVYKKAIIVLCVSLGLLCVAPVGGYFVRKLYTH